MGWEGLIGELLSLEVLYLLTFSKRETGENHVGFGRRAVTSGESGRGNQKTLTSAATVVIDTLKVRENRKVKRRLRIIDSFPFPTNNYDDGTRLSLLSLSRPLSLFSKTVLDSLKCVSETWAVNGPSMTQTSFSRSRNPFSLTWAKEDISKVPWQIMTGKTLTLQRILLNHMQRNLLQFSI